MFSRQAFHNVRSRSIGVRPGRLSGLQTPFLASKRLVSSGAVKPRSNHRFLKIIAGLGIGGTVLYNTNDTFKHGILMVERIGVVTVATIRCFKLYKDTLQTEFETPDARTVALKDTHLKAATITLHALEKNGGIYIKLGQHITALTYLLPPEWTDTMIPLQQQCPQSSMEEIKDLFQRDLGVSIEDYFSEFNPEPVGVASLAQVHIARLKETGEKVAVKIQHPSLQQFVPLDVFLTNTVFDLMYNFFPEYPLTWLGDEMQNSIYTELDFTKEAQNAMATQEYFKKYQDITALRIPNIKTAEHRILIMEYVAGARLDDLKYMQEHDIDTSQVSACLSHIFNNMIFTPGVGVHCDPHGGNLAIRSVPNRNGHNFEIILYDHGLYRQIPLQMRRDYSHFWLAVLDNDVPKMKEFAEKFAGIEGEQKFKIFACAITGRDPKNSLNYDISKPRTKDEMLNIHTQLNEDGILEDLMYILSSMPRIVLLILKTNDLTRNLDEGLNNPLGPERTFLIMANYCARTVYEEQNELISDKYNRFSFKWIIGKFENWVWYHRRLSSLYFYDWIMAIKNIRAKLSL